MLSTLHTKVYLSDANSRAAVWEQKCVVLSMSVFAISQWIKIHFWWFLSQSWYVPEKRKKKKKKRFHSKAKDIWNYVGVWNMCFLLVKSGSYFEIDNPSSTFTWSKMKYITIESRRRKKNTLLLCMSVNTTQSLKTATGWSTAQRRRSIEVNPTCLASFDR
jgi:hypothetical protein